MKRCRAVEEGIAQGLQNKVACCRWDDNAAAGVQSLLTSDEFSTNSTPAIRKEALWPPAPPPQSVRHIIEAHDYVGGTIQYRAVPDMGGSFM